MDYHTGGGEGLKMDVLCGNIARIIGRGGSKIRELEEETGCKIKILKETNNGTTTTVELLGSSDAQHYAKNLIEKFLSNSDSYRSGGSGPPRAYGGGGGEHDDRFENAFKMEVPSHAVSRIIGRGGSKIRELQENSGARINIRKNQGSGPTTQVDITGGQDETQSAKQMIEELVELSEGFQNQNRSDGYRGRSEGYQSRGDGY